MAGAKISVTLDDRELNRQIQKALERNPVETARAVRECLLDLAAESSKRAPIETGDLRRDCRATLNGRTVFENQQPCGGFTPTMRAFGSVGYGLPYALRQHEDLTLRHDRTDGRAYPNGRSVNRVAGGEAKFLERPFLERKAAYIKRMAQIPERSLKR